MGEGRKPSTDSMARSREGSRLKVYKTGRKAKRSTARKPESGNVLSGCGSVEVKRG